MTDLKQTAEFLFQNRSQYHTLTDDDKEYIFFIINRFCSRLFPKQAQLLNNRMQDKAAALDVWYNFFRNYTKIPYKFWGRKNKTKTVTEVPTRYLNILRNMNEEIWSGKLSEDDFRLLWHMKPDDVKFETKVYKESRAQ